MSTQPTHDTSGISTYFSFATQSIFPISLVSKSFKRPWKESVVSSLDDTPSILDLWYHSYTQEDISLEENIPTDNVLLCISLKII